MNSTFLQSIKRAALGSSGMCIPVGQPPVVLLRTVSTTQGWLHAADVTALTEWRNRFVSSFLTEFTATEARTAGWLTDSVGPDATRILFMVDRAADRMTIGYMGLAFIDWETHHGEADAVVRGLPAERGVMREALLTLLTWAEGPLGLTTIGVRVRSDNPAISFYESMGFRAVHRVPLRRLEGAESGAVEWVAQRGAPLVGPSLVHMELAERLGPSACSASGFRRI